MIPSIGHWAKAPLSLSLKQRSHQGKWQRAQCPYMAKQKLQPNYNNKYES